jgi:hypothetical protein
MGFSNQGNGVLSDIFVEKPVDKAFESLQKMSSTHELAPSYPAQSNYDCLKKTSESAKPVLKKDSSASSSSFKPLSINRATSGSTSLRELAKPSIIRDVLETLDIDSITSLTTLQKFGRMYEGPRAQKLRRRLRKMEQKPVGIVRYVMGVAFSVAYSPVTAVIAAVNWISWFLPG